METSQLQLEKASSAYWSIFNHTTSPQVVLNDEQYIQVSHTFLNIILKGLFKDFPETQINVNYRFNTEHVYNETEQALQKLTDNNWKEKGLNVWIFLNCAVFVCTMWLLAFSNTARQNNIYIKRTMSIFAENINSSTFNDPCLFSKRPWFFVFINFQGFQGPMGTLYIVQTIIFSKHIIYL